MTSLSLLKEVSMTHSRFDVHTCHLFPLKDLDKARVRPRWSHMSHKKVNSFQLFWRWKQWLLSLPSWESPLGETHTVLMFVQVADIHHKTFFPKQPQKTTSCFCKICGLSFSEWKGITYSTYSEELISPPLRGKCYPKQPKMPPKHNQESGFPLESKHDLGSFGGRFMFPSTTALGTEEASFAKKQRTGSVLFISSHKSFPILMLSWKRK